MTNRQAIRVVEEIVRENRENGELEGILNRHRIAALNRLIYAITTGIVARPRPIPSSSLGPKQKRTQHKSPV